MKGKEIINYIVRADMPDLERIRERCHTEGVRVKPVYKRRSLILIAVAAILLITTVAVYGNDIINVIQQFMFSDSSITQVEKIETGDEIDGTTLNMWIIKNRSEFAEWGDRFGRYVSFGTLDKALEIIPFEIQEPKFIPGVVFNIANVICFDYTTYGYDIWIQYSVDEIYELNLYQYYVGPDAYIEYTTIESIQKVMVGGIEASVTMWDIWGDDSAKYMRLIWIKDEIMFRLECGSYVYDLDTLIQIAESIE